MCPQSRGVPSTCHGAGPLELQGVSEEILGEALQRDTLGVRVVTILTPIVREEAQRDPGEDDRELAEDANPAAGRIEALA